MTKKNLSLTSRGFTMLVRWAIVLALWVLLISMATGQSGISNYLELVKNRDELAQVNMQVALQNQILEEQISGLRQSRESQVRYLKDNFGYIEKGEFVYHFNRGPIQQIRAKKKPSKTPVTAENKRDGKI